MKKTSLLLAVLMVFGGVMSAQATVCKIKKPHLATITPSTINLMEQNGRVDANFKLDIPKKFVQNRERFVFTPVLTNYDRVAPFQSLIIDGKKFDKVQQKLEKKGRWNDNTNYGNAIMLANTKEARTINYSSSVRYEPWMENADFVVVQKFINQAETVVVAEDIVGRGVKVTPKPVVVPVVEKREQVIHKETGRITVNYKINSSELDMSMDNNSAEMNRLRDLIKKLNSDKNIEIQNITITGSSSPDGNATQNMQLAQRRAETLKNYIVRELNMTPAQAANIKIVNLGANWDGLNQLIMKSDMSGKDQLLNALSTSNLNQRQANMRKSSQFNYLKTNILPQLRYAEYEVNYTIKSERIVRQ